jgi:hypothetical protein
MGQNTFKKFDADAYVRTVETLALEEVGETSDASSGP